MFVNIWRLLQLFFVQPIGGKSVTLSWKTQLIESKTAQDGFIKFEWDDAEGVEAGWHAVVVEHQQGSQIISAQGKLFVPHITQYGFISDIDDTVMVSHSATIYKRLKALFTANPLTREIFDNVAEHYQQLALSHTNGDAPNPFFYVSSSEWNLYDYLDDFFRHNKLPEGAFLLNQVKRWYQLLKTGKTKHMGKLIRIVRILETFPNQQFILLGDNTQQDPVIYNQIAQKYPGRIFAVYIRNVYQANEQTARALLDDLSNHTGIHTCLFNSSSEAMAHSVNIGLIS